jgi:hypothetical protein
MNEVMNRAARRAAGIKKPMIKVTNRIAVVPMEHIETYWAHEIASEGKWASNVPVIIIQPAIDRGRAESHWFDRTLERMWETRRRKGTLPITIGGNVIDVGLVDITVFFEMPAGVLPRREEEYEYLLTENMRHFDLVCSGAFNDQMILATVLHSYHSNGSRLIHCHNLIFGLRQEVRGDVDILGPLDMEPLLKTLAEDGPLNVIGGVRQ